MSIIISVAALLGYINARFIRMPTTIAIMMGSLIISLALVIIGQFGFAGLEAKIARVLISVDFNKLLMQGMLSFLLFAGALTINLNDLYSARWEIGILATLGTITSTILIGMGSFYLLAAMGYAVPFFHCMLFGALISPTDPIAVLAIFKEVGAPRKLQVIVSGESLFNDGVAIVVFLSLLQVVTSQEPVTWQGVSLLFLREAIGGIIYGVLLGMLGYRLLSKIDNYKVEVLITLAMATGGYVLANALGLSGPLAMVCAGIFIGNKGRVFSMTNKSRRNIDNFWELIEEILNAILFLIIGLELLAIQHHWAQVIVGLATIPLVLLVRYLTVSTPMLYWQRFKKYPPNAINILAWGGLRGGLAVALALALPLSKHRDILLTMTYSVVVFSILVQGLTIKPLVKASVT